MVMGKSTAARKGEPIDCGGAPLGFAAGNEIQGHEDKVE